MLIYYPQTLDPEFHTSNPYTPNPEPFIQEPIISRTLNPKFGSLNLKSPQNPKSQVLNPKSRIPIPLT